MGFLQGFQGTKELHRSNVENGRLDWVNSLGRKESLHILHHQSNGFSTRISRYKGVTPLKCGKREARLGQFLGKKL
ncbi:unnamed protein product [Cuscuta campestris]|uniref:Uncharacterized protein n=1 Tax=Cuscuta campestris TaxID=132261 RepID=A0A484M7X9_9ASTE|nr:unnamed protein product [Cuscuta campestris]